MFIIFLLHFGKNFHLKRSKQINKKENIDYKLSKDGERENKMSKNNIFNFLISSNKKLKLLIKKRKIKRKEFHLDESFGKFSKNKHIRTNLEKLNDTIKHHRRRNKKKRGKEIKSILKKMNSFNSNKILNQKVGKSQGDTTNKKLNVIERIKAIEDLKLIKSKNKRKKI